MRLHVKRIVFRPVLFLAVVGALAALPLAQRQTLKSGFDKQDFDTSVRPQDDLFRHVNGGSPSPLNMNACVAPRRSRGCGVSERCDAKTHGCRVAALLSTRDRNISPRA